MVRGILALTSMPVQADDTLMEFMVISMQEVMVLENDLVYTHGPQTPLQTFMIGTTDKTDRSRKIGGDHHLH